jgi:hypothetical protein
VGVGIGGRRTDGVRGLHLQGDGLARHCAQSQYFTMTIMRAWDDVRVFTKICMLTVVLDLDRVDVGEAGLPMSK